MSGPIDNYMGRLRLWLSQVPEPARSARGLEVRQHLEELAAGIVVAGIGLEEAEGVAVARFGSANRVGAGLVFQAVRDRIIGPDAVWPPAALVFLLLSVVDFYQDRLPSFGLPPLPIWINLPEPWHVPPFAVYNYTFIFPLTPFLMCVAGVVIGLLFGRRSPREVLLGIVVWLALMVIFLARAGLTGDWAADVFNKVFLWSLPLVWLGARFGVSMATCVARLFRGRGRADERSRAA